MTDKKRALPFEKKTNLPPKPAADAPPRLVAKKGPAKKAGEIPLRHLRGKKVLKDDRVLRKEQAKRSLEEKGAPMEVVGAKKPRRKAAGPPSERYVRFRVQVKDGQMSIIDSHLVEGSLLTPSTVDANHVYEVTLGEKRLHLDTIPDLGVKRSFTNITGIKDETREHITPLSTYEFDIRIPEKELVAEALPRIDIVLYRTKERPAKMIPGIRPLSVQFERELREVARLKGIKAKMLPK
jgi:hypothetical protein